MKKKDSASSNIPPKNGGEPFPGIRLQNVVDPLSLDQDDLERMKNAAQQSNGNSGGLLTGTFRSRKSRKRGSIGGTMSLFDKSPRKDSIDNTDKKDKEKEKAPEVPRKRNKAAGLDVEDGEVLKKLYDALPAEDKNKVGNPIRFELLHEKTRKIVTNSGIIGEDAEKDPVHWKVLTNTLRFLWVDKGLSFSRKPTKRAEITQQEADQILSGPPPPKLRVNDEIGEGAYGKVFKCKCSNLSKNLLALKKMPNRTEKETKMNLNEVSILTKYGHPNIVALKACYVSTNEYWMVSELMEGGTLEEAMSEYEEQHVAYAARDILSGLEWLHSNGVVHRDLKSPNIMLDIEGVVKLIDFGLAATIEGDKELIQMCGSPYWLSPEMIRMDPHSCPTDIWSFAISLIEMATGRPPNKDNPLGLMYRVGTLSHDGAVEIPADTAKWSPELLDFVTICLHPDPDRRATAKELLNHKFLKKACTKDAMSDILTRIFVKDSLKEIGLF